MVIRMTKLVTVELILRGDIIEKSILAKLAELLKHQKYHADFTSTVAVPPFLVAIEKHYPSLAVLYGTVEFENLFHLQGLIEKFAEEYELEIISLKNL
jgi:hypothetical protein